MALTFMQSVKDEKSIKLKSFENKFFDAKPSSGGKFQDTH